MTKMLTWIKYTLSHAFSTTSLLLYLVCFLGLLASCSAAPELVPASPVPNVVIERIKDNIANPGPTTNSYVWLWLWIPAVCLVSAWAVKALFFAKPKADV